MYLKLMTGDGSYRMIDAVDVTFIRQDGRAFAQLRGDGGALIDSLPIVGTAFVLNDHGNTIDTFSADERRKA